MDKRNPQTTYELIEFFSPCRAKENDSFMSK
jgi:hypothetical protein